MSSESMKPGAKPTNPKLEGFIQTLEKARDAFQNWSDLKTQALIDLDSLAFDVMVMEEDRMKAKREREEALTELHRRENEYHLQLEKLTDELQELKMENTRIQTDFQNAKMVIMKSEQEILDLQQKSEHLLARAKVETEMKIQEATRQYRTQVEDLEGRLDAALLEKSALEKRSDRLESEINQLRTQMMSALKIGEKLDDFAKPKENDFDTDGAPVRKIQPVQEYLKRLGY